MSFTHKDNTHKITHVPFPSARITIKEVTFACCSRCQQLPPPLWMKDEDTCPTNYALLFRNWIPSINAQNMYDDGLVCGFQPPFTVVWTRNFPDVTDARASHQIVGCFVLLWIIYKCVYSGSSRGTVCYYGGDVLEEDGFWFLVCLRRELRMARE